MLCLVYGAHSGLYPGRFNPPGTAQKTYQDTLLAVHAYAQKEGIPYKHVLLDSWWCKDPDMPLVTGGWMVVGG